MTYMCNHDLYFEPDEFIGEHPDDNLIETLPNDEFIDDPTDRFIYGLGADLALALAN